MRPVPKFVATACVAGAALLASIGQAQESPWPVQGPDDEAPPSASIPRPAQLPGHGPRTFGDRPSLAEITEIGRLVFNDRSLSGSGRVSCASCHDPGHAFGPPNRLSAQRGGHRNPPSLKYLQTSIPFTEHFIDDEDGKGIDAGPTGGLTWDGRVSTPREQARIPLFDPMEMANRDVPTLAAKLRQARYADRFRQAFSAPGANVLDDPAETVEWLTAALEFYQQDAATFYPFSSKYDAAMRGQARFTPQEARGMALFNDPLKGNCASCHPGVKRADGGFPLFTDTGHIALGVPRNRALAVNRDPKYFDLGLCGPDRRDLSEHPEYCGLFKAPTLRNTALRGAWFHNGAFHSLREVVDFYVTRDVQPERWYPKDAKGRVRKFDDLPAAYRDNLEDDVPFNPLPDGRPRLTPKEIDDVVVFLGTLTDGYRPAAALKAPSRPRPRSAAR